MPVQIQQWSCDVRNSNCAVTAYSSLSLHYAVQKYHDYSTHCGLVTPYNTSDLDQHYLNQYWVWSSLKSSDLVSDIHLMAISQEVPQPSVAEIWLKITYSIFRIWFEFPRGHWVNGMYKFTLIISIAWMLETEHTTGPWWAPCWPHEPCYQGYFVVNYIV